MDHSEVKNLKRCETCGLHHGYHTHEQWEARHERPKVDHTPAVLDDASKHLLLAAAYIEQNGWWQNRPGFAGYPQACAVVAIDRCGGMAQNEAELRLRQSLGLRRIDDVFAWNDAPERTQDEVVAKLRAVALGIV